MQFQLRHLGKLLSASSQHTFSNGHSNAIMMTRLALKEAGTPYSIYRAKLKGHNGCFLSIVCEDEISAAVS